MALTTYTELQAAIASRLHRSDLTAQIPDYITIAEKRLNRLLRLTDAELEETLTATTSSRVMSLPSAFGSPIALYLTTYLPRQELIFKLPEEMQVYSDNGPASYWTLDGSTLAVDVPADQAYTYVLRYVSEYDIASTATNSLLTKYPDLYLYGSLIEAGVDTKDDNVTARNERRFQQALQECQDDINANRSGATLTTELVRSIRSNIISGDL